MVKIFPVKFANIGYVTCRVEGSVFKDIEIGGSTIHDYVEVTRIDPLLGESVGKMVNRSEVEQDFYHYCQGVTK